MRLTELAAIAIAGLGVLRLAWWAFWPSADLPRHRVRQMRARLRLKLHPGRGHATVAELWARWGRFASWRRSKRSRQSLTCWQRRRPAEHSVLVGRAQFGHRLRLPVEEHALVMAPPRTYKTAFLADVILHYPGPVVSTTTKADVFALTSGVRARCGPVEVFNPQRIGAVPSTFRWNPLDGCEAPAVAIRRADGFAHSVSTEGVDDASFWSSKGSSYMRGLFHAAALAGADFRLVVKWALGDASEAEQILAHYGAGQWSLELGELRSEAQKTAATIRMVLSRALSFMSDPDLAQSVMPGGERFDIPQFLAGRGTLYMIADSDRDDSPMAPLFAMMAGEVHYQAEQIASRTTGGRLDPPLLMALDEIVQTCPVPLPKWAADSGGKGIQLISVTHGEAQLASRWKDHGKQIILDTAGARLFLPGIADAKTLDMAAKLCGQASFKVRGQEHYSQHDIMAPDMIRQIPLGYALVIRGACAPVVAKLPVAWKDPAYRRAKRAGQAVAALTPAPALAEVGGRAGTAVTAPGAQEIEAPAVSPFEDLPEFVPAGAGDPWDTR